MAIFAVPKRDDSLAQQVEHNTFNVGVLGSSPRRITKKPLKKRLFLWSGDIRRRREVPGGEAEAEAATEAAFVHKKGIFCGCRVFGGGICPQKWYLLWMKVSRNCREVPGGEAEAAFVHKQGYFCGCREKIATACPH